MSLFRRLCSTCSKTVVHVLFEVRARQRRAQVCFCELMPPTGSANLMPCAERAAGFLPQRQHAGPPPFAKDPDFVQSRRSDIVEAEPGRFGDAKAGIAGKAQHRPVPGSGPGGGIRGLEQSVDFVPVEMFGRGGIAFFLRNRMRPRSQVLDFR